MLKNKLIAIISLLCFTFGSGVAFAKNCDGYGADVKDGNKIEKMEKEA